MKILNQISGIILFTIGIFFSCTEKITEPETIQFATKVAVIDSSPLTMEIFGTAAVPGARVKLTGVATSLVYQSLSDSLGTAHFASIVPDYYNCEVQRSYSADTVLQIIGIKQEQILVGSKANQALSAAGDAITVTLELVIRAPFVISEIYYNGAPPPPPLYFHDQFTEIYNNSTDTLYLDGYAIGDVDYGHRDDPNYMYCIHLYRFPGGGTDWPVPPGGSVIVAQDADNHTLKNTKSLDLSQADFEYYNPLSNDIDNPNSPNMEQIHHKYGIDFLYSVFNDAIVLFDRVVLDSTEFGPFDLLKVPKSWVVDGVEYKEDLGNFEFKRLSDDIDAGITGGMPAYQGKSVARKVFKIIGGQKVLSDNNNSTIDFQILDVPSPGSIE